MAFNSIIQIANLISKDTFNFIIKQINLEDIQVWPSNIHYILNSLGTEELL